MLFLKNDYSVCAHPAVLDEIVKNNLVYSDSYCNDERCEKTAAMVREQIGDPDAAIHYIIGGTLVNKTCLAAFLKPYEAVITTVEGHIAVHETGAVEATGHRLLEVPTDDGKLDPAAVDRVCAIHNMDQMVVPRIIYITNTTEPGTVYTLAELEALRECCDRNNLLMYMDGARLAMALGAEKCDYDLSDIARLCDAFYIGGGKCGALAGELVVITNDELKPFFRQNMRQNGALFAKGMIVGMQFDVLLRDGLYQELGRHCDELGKKLADGIKAKGYKLAHEQESNMVFPIFTNEMVAELEKKVMFEDWEDNFDGTRVIRLVTSWVSTEDEVNEFLDMI